MIEYAAVQSYNEGVKAFQSSNWSEAVKCFTNVLEQSSTSSPLRSCAVYARALAGGRIRQRTEIPSDLQQKTDEVGDIYVSWTFAGKLLADGHQIAIDPDNPKAVDVVVNGHHYKFSCTSYAGRYHFLITRLTDGKSLILWEVVGTDKAIPEDKYLVNAFEFVRGGTPNSMPLPPSGFAISLQTQVQR